TLQIPDYAAARQTTGVDDFRVDELGFALVECQFPAATRFPCLALDAPHGRGLVYPLGGESYATSPGIVLARRLGAQIKIKSGVVIPWVKNSTHPFHIVISDLRRRRSATY